MKESTNYEGKSTFAKFYIPTLILFLVIVTLLFGKADIDTTPPQMSNLSVDFISKNSAIISWTTDEAAVTEIQYGLEPGYYLYRKTHEDFVTQRNIQLNLLTPNITYYYVAISTDIFNNSNQSEEFSFTTLEEKNPPMWHNISITPASNSTYNNTEIITVNVTWTTLMGVDKALIYHNFTGNDSVAEMTALEENVFTFNISKPSAGNYYWFLIANDTINRTNQTEAYNYSINKSQPELKLLLNSTENNLTIYEFDSVNISGILQTTQGVIELLINDTPIMSSSSGLEKINFFNSPGLFFITLKYNETENYTQKEIHKQIEVKPLTLNVTPNQKEYGLGALGGYIVTFPQGATVNLEICGPKPTSGSGFIECFNQPTLTGFSSPYAQTHSLTKKPGEYVINAQTNHKGVTLSVVSGYNVSNTLTLSINGDSDFLTGEEIDLRVSGSGGIAPYTYEWKLPNSSIITDNEIEIAYPTAGTYSINVTVKDSEDNKNSQIYKVKVEKANTVRLEIFDRVAKKAVQEANVDIDGQDKWTDSAGIVIYKIKNGEYVVDINAEGYQRLRQTLNVDGDKSIRYELDEADETQLTTNADGVKITMGYPIEGAKLASSNVQFDAFIETNTNIDCSLYLSAKGDSWSKEIKSYKLSSSSGITHNQDVDAGTIYNWKIECKTGSNTYTSITRTFTVGDEEGSYDPEIVNAGEIRQKLEQAQDNLEKLDAETTRIAEVLNLRTKTELAIKEYDRIIRDINNIKYRRDLSDADQEAKKEEYKDKLLAIEEEIPLNIVVDGSNKFVYYPTMEELMVVADEYAVEKQITSKINEREFEDLQNKILINTVVSHVELTMIDGSSKKITLIEKQISYTDEIDSKAFIIEYVPKDIVSTASEIMFVNKEVEIIKEDPILKFSKDTNVVYYVEGIKEFDLVKSSYTILLSDAIFKGNKANKLTGAVALRDIDFSSPLSIIVLLSIIIVVYISYAFEVPEKVYSVVTSLSKKKTIDHFFKLIEDSKDYLKVNDVGRANLVFKEIKLMYEKSNDEIKLQVYEDAINLLDYINSTYFEITLEDVQRKKATNTVSSQNINLLLFAYHELNEKDKVKYVDLIKNFEGGAN